MHPDRIRLIVVDNEVAFREPVAKVLRKHGFSVDISGDAGQYINLLLEKSSGAYDVVLLGDLFVPEQEESKENLAVSLIKHTKTLYPNVQVIVISGRGMQSALEVLQAGAYRFLAKPFNLEELVVIIQAAVRSRKQDDDKQINVHSELIKILFLAANPLDSTRLRLDEEIRAVDFALLQTKFRDRFDVRQHWAVRATDLQSYLLRHKPNIIHFSGHGSKSSEIILEDNVGNSRPVSVRALSNLFSALKDNIQCVVLNACYSEQQARAIAEHIDCVVGMSKAIGDASAISFATAFYQALGYGRDVQTAFDLGCMQIDLENLGEQDTPKLLALDRSPKELIFVQK